MSEQKEAKSKKATAQGQRRVSLVLARSLDRSLLLDSVIIKPVIDSIIKVIERLMIVTLKRQSATNKHQQTVVMEIWFCVRFYCVGFLFIAFGRS